MNKGTKYDFSYLSELGLADRINEINNIRSAIHVHSPFSDEPVDFVRWVELGSVVANDYNPNAVAPPEMELLRLSMSNDGFTQPVVAWDNGEKIEVVDGFHRNRVARECPEVTARLHGYIPIAIINGDRENRGDRIASTIRHNRARGKHRVDAMSDIVIELKNRNWKNARISRELGMDEDEVLRLCQVTGLADLFKDEEFSRSWEIEDSEPEYVPLTDEIDIEEKEQNKFRTVNTGDDARIFHTFDKWECHKAGFYNPSKDGLKKEEAEAFYASFLGDDTRFRYGLDRVVSEWVHSCEHYLTNVAMNRIAWLGQAAACYSEGLPSVYCGGFNLLTKDAQNKANRTALEYLNQWLLAHERAPVSLDEALTGRQSTIY